MFVGIWHKSLYILKMTKYKVLFMHCYLFQEWSGNKIALTQISQEEYEKALNEYEEALNALQRGGI